MEQPERPRSARPSAPVGPGDGWSVFTLLLAGVAVYGGVGWLLDAWLGTAFLLPVGLLGGTVAALYMVYQRF